MGKEAGGMRLREMAEVIKNRGRLSEEVFSEASSPPFLLVSHMPVGGLLAVILR